LKIAGQSVERFLDSPDPKIAAVLIYGPDAGLVRERADRLIRAVAGSADDPFRVARLSPTSLRDDPARLGDEMSALSMTGGRRVVHLADGADGLARLFEDLLEDSPGPSLLVVEAGDLPAKSALRKIFEASAGAAALACYLEDRVQLRGFITAELRRHRLIIAPEALDFLSEILGSDRAITRSEIEKLALYMGAGEAGRVELDDVLACAGDNAALALDDIAFAVAGGDLASLDRGLDRNLAGGAQPVSVLRATARHLMRLHQVRYLMEAGADRDAATATLRPVVFWKRRDQFRRQLIRWPTPALATALERLLDAEDACKMTGSPDEAICRQALLDIARSRD
jgi:DNA polymerase-3 subunit delta